MTKHDTAHEVGISIGFTGRILNKDLGIQRVVAKCAQVAFTGKTLHVEVKEEMQLFSNSDSGFLKTMVTREEMWV